MAKNVTIAIPDELNQKMELLEEVNWSAVARTAIEEYVDARSTPDLTPMIEKLSKEKKKEYNEGVKEASRIISESSYVELDSFFATFSKMIRDKKEERTKFNLQEHRSMEYDITGSFGLFRKKLTEGYVSDDERYDIFITLMYNESLIKSTKHSSEFVKGLYHSLFELKGKLKI